MSDHTGPLPWEHARRGPMLAIWDGDIMQAIISERVRQDSLRDGGRFPATCADVPGLTDEQKLAVLVEEVGEVARAVMHHSGLVKDGDDLRKELIQAAAVIVAWLEALSRE